jgi:hypothetical protein
MVSPFLERRVQRQQGVDCQQDDVVVPQQNGRSIVDGWTIAFLSALLAGTLDTGCDVVGYWEIKVVMLDEGARGAAEQC